MNRDHERDGGHDGKRGDERGNERDHERGNERDHERGNERGSERGGERDHERGGERDHERGDERDHERGDERGNERGGERGNERDGAPGDDPGRGSRGAARAPVEALEQDRADAGRRCAPLEPGSPDGPSRFPRSFWTANLTELFERGAYYSMASFVVLYLGQLGLGKYWPSTLNGLLWTLVYFLPILSGTIADQVGFRRSLLVAFVLLAGGYFLMGFPVWLGGAELAETVSNEVTADASVIVPALGGIALIGLGGSIVKPCIAGTVQKTSGVRTTLGFGIFYMVINIGSLFGRCMGYLARTRFSLSFIFLVAMCCAVGAFFVVLLLYREPERSAPAPDRPRRSPGRILLDMFLVLRSGRFTLFLLVSSGFNFLYSQVYNVLPLYLKKVVETNPAVDLYTMANPVVIVCCQLLITKRFGKMKPIRSMIVGSVMIGVSMLINLWPIYATGGVRGAAVFQLPLGSLFIILTVALVAFGELFTSARTYEYIGALAPKGQEGLFLGYANLPMAIGSLVGGPVGAAIFNEVICKDATNLPMTVGGTYGEQQEAFNELMCNGATCRESGLFSAEACRAAARQRTCLLDVVPRRAALGWLILMGIGFASAAAMWLYHRWLEQQSGGATDP